MYSENPSVPFIFDPYDRLNLDDVKETLPSSGSQILANLGGDLMQFKEMSLDSFELILDFGRSSISSQFKCESISYINHPEGPMRWLFKGSNLKSVLAFYNASGRRAKLISTAIKLLSFFRLKNLVRSGSFKVYSKRATHLQNHIDDCCDDYNVFMGTPGAQRSILIGLIQSRKVVEFLKIPTNSATTKLIQNEKQAILRFRLQPSEYVKVPALYPITYDNAIRMENLRLNGSIRTDEFTSVHSAFISNSIETSRVQSHLGECEFWKNARQSFEKSQDNSNVKLAQLAELGTKVMDLSNTEIAVWTNWAHGDFTPWNMFVSGDRISLYDWEMYRAEAPILFDLFHFHYQKGILMDRASLLRIQEDLGFSLESKDIKSSIQLKGADIQLYHRLYLLTAVSYFVEVFSHQKLSAQNHWQIQCWTAALTQEFNHLKVDDCREHFILDLNDCLEEFEHAFLKFDYESLAHFPESSDLDIAIRKEDVNEVISFCRQNPWVKKFKNYHKSFMSILEIHLLDGSFLSIDLIYEFKRKDVTFLSTDDLLEHRTYSKKRVMIPDLKHDLAYTYAFYTLNHSNIPLRYFEHFLNHEPKITNRAVNHLNSIYGTSFESIEEVLTQGHHGAESLRKAVRRRSFTAALKSKFTYIKDTFNDLIKRRGYIVTFSGVDGAGKSTIIEIVKENIETKYRKKVVLLRHRPGVLPILSAIKHGKSKAEKIAGKTLPRQGKNRSPLSSTLRFSYYYLDYLIGQIYVYFRYILRGKIVLYDRYYFDFINDAKRSNIEVNRKLSKALYRFVMKPKLNIFLYAQPETILARKQELKAEDIKELTQNYYDLFTGLSLKSKKSRYTCIENNVLDDTVAAVLKEFSIVA